MAAYTGLFETGTLAGRQTPDLIIATGGYATVFGTVDVLLIAGSVVIAGWDLENPGPSRPSHGRVGPRQ